MRVTQLHRLDGYRCFDSVSPLTFETINLLVGPNNVGKTSFLAALLGLQDGLAWKVDDLRRGERSAVLGVELDGIGQLQMGGANGGLRLGSETRDLFVSLNSDLRGEGSTLATAPREGTDVLRSPGFHVRPFGVAGPERGFITFLGGRRPHDYERAVGANVGVSQRDLRNLANLVSPLSQSGHPQHRVFADACVAMLGFEVSVGNVDNGQLPGIWGATSSGDGDFIPLPALGAGVAHAAGFLAELATAKDRVFVIEEPETELHPKALKALLRLIESAATRNQFFISTHSNLVVRQLGGSGDAAVFAFESNDGTSWPPTSRITPVERDPDSRSELLLSLGYETTELASYEGWLFFEESTIERLIRSFLIPWFVPEMVGIVRTVATNGAERAPGLVEEFWRVLLYTHLEGRFRGRAWALLDGDGPGRDARDELARRFPGPEYEGHFRCWSQDDSERFLPARFATQARQALEVRDRRERRTAKHALWEEVWDWIASDSERARSDLAESAAEVVHELKAIAIELATLRESGV